tara:strand:+ start:243 stop:416 length:174 start_codon:yes stop_codon:yes gene_type:complete
MTNEIKNGEHKALWVKMEAIEREITNHISSRLSRLEQWQWGIVAIIVGSVILAKLLP